MYLLGWVGGLERRIKRDRKRRRVSRALYRVDVLPAHTPGPAFA